MHRFLPRIAVFLLIGIVAARAASLDQAKLAEMDSAITQAITDQKVPGGVLWLEREGTVYHKAYGSRALVPANEAMTEDTIFDAASLTKVLATTPAIMLLAERGKIDVDAPVARYLPAFAQNGKEGILVRHLLTHTGGLRSGLTESPTWSGYDGAIQRCCLETPQSAPGSAFLYSDLDFIVLGEIVRQVAGESLATFTAREIFTPLRMVDTGFLPDPKKLPRIAPTEFDREGKMLRGVVHDPTSRRMGGVVGHAGLFTTAADVARFARMMLNGGELEGTRILSAETVRRMTQVQTRPEISRRGFGWDIDSAYSGPRGSIFPRGSYGHTGWTGTSLWIDPWSKTFVIFLGNRVHPDGKGDVVPLRSKLGTLAAEATGFDFKKNLIGVLPPRATREPTFVLNGIDVLVREHFIRLRGLKIGLVTNHTGRDRNRNATIDLLHAAPDLKLVALFSPEHGIRGNLEDGVGDAIDEKTGLPIRSLYPTPPARTLGQSDADYDAAVLRSREPQPEQMNDIDTLVFDIQDIGARFYTYPATLGGVLAAAGRAHKKVYLLDRVDPIDGLHVEGPLLSRPPNFTGYHTLPIRHGMTLGELARMFNAELRFNADLSVVACEGWTRDMTLAETDLPWTDPSPNMRSLTAALLYPGVCMVESTSVSVGRGTDKPFEQIGAPYIDDVRLARELNQEGVPGVRFIPIRFTPRPAWFSADPSLLKYRDQECGGVLIMITDRSQLRSVDLGVVLAQVLHRLYPRDFDVGKMVRLVGDEPTIEDIRAGKTLAEIKARWATGLEQFEVRRKPFLIYPTATR